MMCGSNQNATYKEYFGYFVPGTLEWCRNPECILFLWYSPFYDFIYAVTCYKYCAMQIIASMLLVDATDEAEFIFILSV